MGFDDDERHLQEGARAFLARHLGPGRVRELMETETAHDPELWRGMAGEGWLALPSAVERAALAEVMGERCLPGPFLQNLWASSLLAAAGAETAERALARIARGELLATVALLEASADWDPARVAAPAEAQGDGFQLFGTKVFVGDAASAGLVVWAARLDGELALFAAERDAFAWAPTAAIDLGRKLYRLRADGVRLGPEALLARGPAAHEALARATREATVAVTAELVGGMGWVLETSLAYAKTRRQFGRPIGAFQAVQHRLADMLLRLEGSRSAVAYAARAVASDDPEADHLVSIAKAYVSEAALEVAESGIQVHGGVGFTWDHDLHLYYRRAKSSEILFGDATYHRERIARRIIDQKEP